MRALFVCFAAQSLNKTLLPASPFQNWNLNLEIQNLKSKRLKAAPPALSWIWELSVWADLLARSTRLADRPLCVWRL